MMKSSTVIYIHPEGLWIGKHSRWGMESLGSYTSSSKPRLKKKRQLTTCETTHENFSFLIQTNKGDIVTL